MKTYILIFIYTLVLSGCTSLGREIVLNDLKKHQPEETYKIITNYKIGEVTNSNIGSAMIKAEDIIINDYPNWEINPGFKALNDIEISGLFQTRRIISPNVQFIKYDANSIFKVIGRLTRDDYYVIEMDKSDNKFLVDKEGKFVANKFLMKNGDHYHYIDVEMKTTPNEIKFDFIPPLNQKYRTVTKYGVSGSFRSGSTFKSVLYKERPVNIPEVNYELIYGGKDSTALHIIYREYTSEGAARQAFFQNLNYESNARIIRFKNTNIEIVSADNEKIIFKVLNDDISDLEKIGNAALTNN